MAEDTIFITGRLGDTPLEVACGEAAMTGSAPVMAWLTSVLAGLPYALATVRQVVLPQLPRLFSHVYEVIDYTDTERAPVPVISHLVPESIAQAGADVTLHVYGRDFTPRSQILFNNGPETTGFVSTTELTTVVSGATATTPGWYPVQVETPGPGGGRSGGQWFFVLGTGAITVGRETGSVQWQVPLQQKGGGFYVGT